ncbi:hypothetical protein BC832DRAFT_568073 [Gaertneriomyces semiglobifer]|nr:hypothetical protein BC832DRAFT_568073 [Gaertneriomyces semiglobifer]
MRLRCRTPLGVSAIGSGLTPSSTVADLKQNIETVTGISVHMQQLKTGFPPKILDKPDNATLQESGIRDGEQIVVEQVQQSSVTGGNASTQPASTAPSSTTTTPTITETPSHDTSTGHNRNESISVADGILLVREMKDDNSCLFRSIGYVIERSAEVHARLRKIVADTILNDPVTYNEAILGRTPDSYTSWITTPNSWGGAIELAVFSDVFQVEIDSIDVATLRVDKFGEGKYPKRVILFYSGIHYDAVALSPTTNAPEEFDQTTFEGTSTQGETVLAAAIELARIWNQKRKFTDLANFTLKCGVCGKGLRGQKEAQAHAMEVGHTEFTEY